jgi:hypothetical protein
MRRLARLLAVAGAVALAVAVCWAYAQRASGTHVGVSGLLAAGTALGLAATGLLVVVETRPGRLILPDDVRALPEPAWWAPLGAVGASDVVGGAYASAPMTAVGVALIGGSLVVAGRTLRRPPRVLDRTTVRLARWARAFGDRHARAGDSTLDGILEHVGRGAHRLVLVAGDGRYGDLVAPDRARAELAARLAGVTVHEQLPREVVARIRTGPYEWQRMAGLQLGGRT